MMKRALLSLALLAIHAPAGAADLGKKPDFVAKPYTATPSSWAGFYLGAHAGYGWGRDSFKDSDGSSTNFNTNGVLGGLHVGYQWQTNRFVYGLEGDLSLTDVTGKRTVSDPFEISRQKVTTNMLGTLRARLGYDLGPALLYGTGGVALRSWRGKSKDTDIPTGLVYTGKVKTGDNVGFALGAGVEYKVTQSLVARLEGLHYIFPDASFKFNGVKSNDSKFSQNATVVRAGLSWLH